MKRKETFGQWFKRRRHELGFTNMSELARLTNISKQYLSEIENETAGKSGRPSKISVEMVDKIARGLGVLPDEARLAAGYAPQSAPTLDDNPSRKILMYLEQLPEHARADMLAMIETLWRRHQSENSARARTTDHTKKH